MVQIIMVKFKVLNSRMATSVDVRLYGSEFYMRAEGLDGYTLVRDETTDWICYAKLSEDGSSLIATHLKLLWYTSKSANTQGNSRRSQTPRY